MLTPEAKKHPMIATNWSQIGPDASPLAGYPPEVRKIIYTTKRLETLNMQLRKVRGEPRALPKRRDGAPT